MIASRSSNTREAAYHRPTLLWPLKAHLGPPRRSTTSSLANCPPKLPPCAWYTVATTNVNFRIFEFLPWVQQARHVRIAGVRYAMRGLTRIAGWRRLMQQTAGATSSSSSTFAALGAAGGVVVAAADMLIAVVAVAAHGECSALCWCAHTVLCNHPVNSSIRICSSTVQIFP